MRTREPHRQGPSRLSEPGIPGCGTGPAGRLRFVAAELANLLRRLRGQGAEAGAQKDDRGGEKR
jgi:hypothetical protein